MGMMQWFPLPMELDLTFLGCPLKWKYRRSFLSATGVPVDRDSSRQASFSSVHYTAVLRSVY